MVSLIRNRFFHPDGERKRAKFNPILIGRESRFKIMNTSCLGALKEELAGNKKKET